MVNISKNYYVIIIKINFNSKRHLELESILRLSKFVLLTPHWSKSQTDDSQNQTYPHPSILRAFFESNLHCFLKAAEIEKFYNETNTSCSFNLKNIMYKMNCTNQSMYDVKTNLPNIYQRNFKSLTR